MQCSTGLRITECLTLDVHSLSRDGIAGRSVYALRNNTKGKARGRRIPYSEYCREAMQQWLEYSGLNCQPEHTTLWPVSIGGRCEAVRYDYSKTVSYEAVVRGLRLAIRAAGLTGKVLTHSCRKFFAQSIYEATGHDVLAVRDALGQTDIASTMHYLGTDDARLTHAIRGVL